MLGRSLEIDRVLSESRTVEWTYVRPRFAASELYAEKFGPLVGSLTPFSSRPLLTARRLDRHRVPS